MITTINFRNDLIGLRPFNARSLVLSVLLGLDPPVLPTRSLLRLAELFEIAPGTMRTALSRMVVAGDLSPEPDGYRLVGRLLERKAAQDIGRRPADSTWTGDWWIAVVTAVRRTVAERRWFRSHMANLRMGELRPDTWLRPANLVGPDGDRGLVVVRGPLTGEDPAGVARRLWPLGELAMTARQLQRLLDETALDGSATLPPAITRSAAVVRFLRVEPLLPLALTPQPWPPDELRARYRSFARTLGRTLERVLR